ncbi:MAG: hypothetical protein K2M95_06470 [Clostridiales bacterium]|nr:hypothetical protein [Clostridiales bacterium]
MELHNTYTVRSSGGCVTAHNAVSANFKRLFLNHVAWAKLAVLTEEDGTRTEAPCSLQFVNADILKGGSLRAVYTAQFEGKNGAVYKKVAIAAEPNGEFVSSAEINFAGNGDSISVKTTIVLDCTYNGDVLLTGGDNALVRRLLGAGESGTFAVSTGTSTYPSYPSLRSNSLLGTQEQVTPTLLNGKVVFGGTKTKASGRELVLHYKNNPVLRVVRSGLFLNQTLSYTVQNGSVLIPDNNTEMITSVTVGNAMLMAYDAMRVTTSALRVNSDTLAVGADGYVMSDPGEEYMAVVTHAYVEVYKPDPVQGSIACILRVPRLNEQVTLCRGGTLALWSANILTLYERTNDVYDVRRLAIARGNSGVVVREGVRYHVATVRSSILYRYAVEGSTVTQLETVAVPLLTPFLVGRCGDYVVYGSSPFTVRSIDVDRSAEYNCNGFVGKVAHVGDTGSYFALLSDSQRQYAYDFVRGTMKTVDSGYVPNGRLLYKENGMMYIYDAANGLQTLTGDFLTFKLTSACIAGGFLFTVANGIMTNLYLSGGAIALRLPASDNGKRCNVTVRCKSLPASGSPIRFLMT